MPASGSGAQSGAVPLMAAVVTAAPFNVAYIPGAAQTTILPTIDAMAQINMALEFLGPGGAIYVPSGTYGAGSTATTLSSRQIGAVNSPKELGQTIIFGGAVSFVALPALSGQPAFVFGSSTVTIGTPTFYDLGLGTVTSNLYPVTLLGPGTPYTVPIDLVSPALSGQVIMTDDLGNMLAGTISSSTGTSLTLTSTAEDLAFGTQLVSGATVFQPITVGAAIRRTQVRRVKADPPVARICPPVGESLVPGSEACSCRP